MQSAKRIAAGPCLRTGGGSAWGGAGGGRPKPRDGGAGGPDAPAAGGQEAGCVRAPVARRRGLDRTQGGGRGPVGAAVPGRVGYARGAAFAPRPPGSLPRVLCRQEGPARGVHEPEPARRT